MTSYHSFSCCLQTMSTLSVSMSELRVSDTLVVDDTLVIDTLVNRLDFTKQVCADMNLQLL